MWIHHPRQAFGIHPQRMNIMRKEVSRDRLENRECPAGEQSHPRQREQESPIAENRLEQSAIVGWS
jgi:hypothetical protein